MIGRTAAYVLAAGLLSASTPTVVFGRGHGGGHGGHFAGSAGFHGGFHGGGFHGGGFHHFHGGGFRTRVFIGGTFFAPYYPYYDPYYNYPPAQYIEPYPPPPPQSYWYYCPDSRAYYPYVQQCPSGWLPVAPQPPS